MSEKNIIILLIGATGNGKSQAGNFFMKKEVFTSKTSFKPVTSISTSSEGIVGGKKVTIIDTPGFLDPNSLTSAEEFMALAKAIKAMSDGIDAIGFVINVKNRITSEDKKLLENLLALKEMIPYTFIIFTHAKGLATTDKEQELRIEEMIKDTKHCPDILQKVLSSIKNRFMLLESVETMGEDYHDKKSEQLLWIVQQITHGNRKKYNPPLSEFAKQVEKFNGEGRQEEVERLNKELMAMKLDLSRQTRENQNTPSILGMAFNFFVQGVFSFATTNSFSFSPTQPSPISLTPSLAHISINPSAFSSSLNILDFNDIHSTYTPSVPDTSSFLERQPFIY